MVCTNRETFEAAASCLRKLKDEYGTCLSGSEVAATDDDRNQIIEGMMQRFSLMARGKESTSSKSRSG